MLFKKNNKKDSNKDRKSKKREVVLENSNPFDFNENPKPAQETRTIIKVVKEKKKDRKVRVTNRNGKDKGSGSSISSFKIFIIIILLVVIAGGLLFINYRKKNVGVQAVMDMYNYDSIPQLAEQQKHLQRITTEKVYNFNTVENAPTALQTYLKFKQKPVKVNIINHGEGWVLYSLVTPYIAPSRHFVLLYKTNALGTINYMRQEEAIDFFNYSEDNGAEQ